MVNSFWGIETVSCVGPECDGAGQSGKDNYLPGVVKDRSPVSQAISPGWPGIVKNVSKRSFALFSIEWPGAEVCFPANPGNQKVKQVGRGLIGARVAIG